MTDADWIIVWDFRDTFPWYLITGPAMVAGASLLFYFKLLGYDAWISDVWGAVYAWISRILGYPIIVLVLVAGLFGTYLSASHFLGQRAAFERGEYAVSEGMAAVINPSPASAAQVLEVGGESFEYSVHDGAFDFAGRFTEGGIVQTGMQLRISHIDGRILRVERREQPPTDTPH